MSDAPKFSDARKPMKKSLADVFEFLNSPPPETVGSSRGSSPRGGLRMYDKNKVFLCFFQFFFFFSSSIILLMTTLHSAKLELHLHRSFPSDRRFSSEKMVSMTGDWCFLCSHVFL